VTMNLLAVINDEGKNKVESLSCSTFKNIRLLWCLFYAFAR
jgi:hypothetical protein